MKDWLTTIGTIAGLIALAFVIRSFVLKKNTTVEDDGVVGIKPADKEDEGSIAGEVPGEEPTDPDTPMDWESAHHPFLGYPEEPAPVAEIKITAPPGKAKHPHDDMVHVPGGDFRLGFGELPLASPPHQIYVGAFMIDRYEVTNEEYQKFVTETDHPDPALPDEWAVDYSWRVGQYPKGTGDHPVTLVSFADAVAYCKWAGKRLPTGSEWEKAARGTDGRAYPWGPKWDGRKAHTVERITGPLRAASQWTAIVEGEDDDQVLLPFPVGSYPGDASPYGAYDMHGNVHEWVDGLFKPYPGADEAQSQLYRRDDVRVVRGSSYANRDYGAPLAARFPYEASTRDTNIGFRCAKESP